MIVIIIVVIITSIIIIIIVIIIIIIIISSSSSIMIIIVIVSIKVPLSKSSRGRAGRDIPKMNNSKSYYYYCHDYSDY